MWMRYKHELMMVKHHFERFKEEPMGVTEQDLNQAWEGMDKLKGSQGQRQRGWQRWQSTRKQARRSKEGGDGSPQGKGETP